jgi:hypothetical protein
VRDDKGRRRYAKNIIDCANLKRVNPNISEDQQVRVIE